jgi:arylamine N-acetyltransferase
MFMQIERFLRRHALSPRQADLRLLQDVASAYSSLPYENVTKILKDARCSSSYQKFRQTEEVFEDHLRWNTGGTCFSLCNALEGLLTFCGFEAFIAMADMHYGANIHCAIVVALEQDRYLLDPGYLLHQPLPLPATEINIVTKMNTVVLKNEGEEQYSLFTKENGIQKWRYRLKAVRVSREEFEQHWLHSFSLNSMENVMITRLSDSGRLYYRKDRIEVVQHDLRKKQKIESHDVQTLSQTFGLPSDLILQAQQVLLR